MRKNIKNFLENTSIFFALIGGMLLLFILFITLLNIIGRKFGFPISGDFEIVELSMATIIFLFLPYCQMKKANISIKTFTKKFNTKVNIFLDFSGTVMLGALGLLFAWRILFGGIDYYNFNDQTMVLQIPKFIVFIPVTISSFLLVIVCAYEAMSIFNIKND